MDWVKIRNEFETTPATLKELAEKYGIKEGTVRSRKCREKWKKKDPEKPGKKATPKKSATQRKKQQKKKTQRKKKDAALLKAKTVKDIAITKPSRGPNWDLIRLEYIQDKSTSYRSLAEKYNVSDTTLTRRAGKEDWPAQRQQYWVDLTSRAEEYLKDQGALATARQFQIAAKAMELLERQLFEATLAVKKNTRSKIARRVDSRGNVIEEKSISLNTPRVINLGVVDGLKVKRVTGALRDLKFVMERKEAEGEGPVKDLLDALADAARGGGKDTSPK